MRMVLAAGVEKSVDGARAPRSAMDWLRVGRAARIDGRAEAPGGFAPVDQVDGSRSDNVSGTKNEALPPRDAGIFRLWPKLPIRVHRPLRTDPRASAYSATTHAEHRRSTPRPGPPPSVDRAVQRGTGDEDRGDREGGDKFFGKIVGATAGLLTPTLTSPWEGEGIGVVGAARPCPWQSRTPSLFRGRGGVGVERH